MARKLRLQYEDAIYHVINRGNYRQALFTSPGARAAFLTCLDEACRKCQWIVHAYVLMSNHYHLALETPQPNLVAGMKWLQSTFANRFNRLRKVQGHVFQGRYRAIAVEDEEHLGAVCHYIHLNPVRARLLPAERLGEYKSSSFPLVLSPKHRPPWLRASTCLRAAGSLQDTTAGHRQYQAYLEWLAESEPEQKRLKFEQMTSGWALGSKGFKTALLEDHKAQLAGTPGEAETRETRELRWQRALEAALGKLGKNADDIARDRKAAPWKLALASHFKTISPMTNVWLAPALNMGAPAALSRSVSQFRAAHPQGKAFTKRISTCTV